MKIEIDVDEALKRYIKKFGSSSHITLPKKHIGKEAFVFISDKALGIPKKIELSEQDKEWIKGLSLSESYAEDFIEYVEGKKWELKE